MSERLGIDRRYLAGDGQDRDLLEESGADRRGVRPQAMAIAQVLMSGNQSCQDLVLYSRAAKEKIPTLMIGHKSHPPLTWFRGLKESVQPGAAGGEVQHSP